MCNMEGKDLNRLKVVLAEKKRTNKWLAEQIGVDQATVSKWCTNSAQPNLENLMEVAKCILSHNCILLGAKINKNV